MLTKEIDWSTPVAAASTLDMLVPDWYTRVNLETLNMGSLLNCVLGQVYKKQWEANPDKYSASVSPYGWGARELGLWEKEAAAGTLSFSAKFDSEWRTEIKKRQA